MHLVEIFEGIVGVGFIIAANWQQTDF